MVNSEFHNMHIQTRISIGHLISFQLAISSTSKQQNWHCNPFPILVRFDIGAQFNSKSSISTSKQSLTFFADIYYISDMLLSMALLRLNYVYKSILISYLFSRSSSARDCFPCLMA
jgi:hypothetical protein